MLKEGSKDIKQLSLDAGVQEKQLKPFLDKLIEQKVIDEKETSIFGKDCFIYCGIDICIVRDKACSCYS